jgi:hypothetical protein
MLWKLGFVYSVPLLRSVRKYVWTPIIIFALLDHAQSTHRVAMADFWRTSHHDGKISPDWWGWRCKPVPFYCIYHHVESCSVGYAPDERADTLPLFNLYTYMYSVGSRTICRYPGMYGTRQQIPVYTKKKVLWGLYRCFENVQKNPCFHDIFLYFTKMSKGIFVSVQV